MVSILKTKIQKHIECLITWNNLWSWGRLSIKAPRRSRGPLSITNWSWIDYFMIETDSPLIIPIVNWRYIISQFYFLLLFEKIGTEEYLICYLLFKEYLISYLFFIEEYLIPYLLFKEYLISYLFLILLLALQISYHIVLSGARVANTMDRCRVWWEDRCRLW